MYGKISARQPCLNNVIFQRNKGKHNCLPYHIKYLIIFAFQTVVVAQLVRASDCDSEGRGFEPHHPPNNPRHVVWD